MLAEKPSVARDIARVLGATSKGDGYLHGNGYVVTWAIGHLAALAQPHEIDPEWRQWRRDLLPMLPEQWPLVVYEKTKDQFEVVAQDPDFAARLARGVRHGRGPRRRADLPLHLRGGAVREAGQPAVDLFADAGRHPQGLRRAAARRRLRSAGRCRARPQPGRLAGGHESLARLLPGLRRGALGGPRADADAGHAGGARTGDPRLRAGRLPGSRRHLSPRRRAAEPYQGTWFRTGSRSGATRNPATGDAAAAPMAKRRGRIVERARTGDGRHRIGRSRRRSAWRRRCCTI